MRICIVDRLINPLVIEEIILNSNRDQLNGDHVKKVRRSKDVRSIKIEVM